MIRRAFFFVIALMITTLQTQASTQTSLKGLYDNLSYSLNVEWDQKDQSFYDKKMNEFNAQIDGLRNDGMTNEELLQLVMSETKNTQLKKELETTFTLIHINKVGQAEAQKMIKEAFDRTYNRGASWNGEVWSKIGYGLIGLLIVAWVVGYVSCVSDPNSTTYCYTDTVCSYDYTYGNDCYQSETCGCSH